MIHLASLTLFPPQELLCLLLEVGKDGRTCVEIMIIAEGQPSGSKIEAS